MQAEETAQEQGTEQLKARLDAALAEIEVLSGEKAALECCGWQRAHAAMHAEDALTAARQQAAVALRCKRQPESLFSLVQATAPFDVMI